MPNTPQSNATHKYVDSHDVSLKEHLEDRITNLEKSLDERFKSQEKAIITALGANEKRLDSMNEFRETLRDQNKTFITKNDHESLIVSYQKDIDRIGADIESLKISRAELEGKASQTQLNINFVFTLVSFMIAIASFILGLYGH